MKRIRCFIRLRERFAAVMAVLAFTLLLFTVLCGAVPLKGEKELYSGIIRFHVLANSDSEEDQNLKLYVRDCVTEYTEELLVDCNSISEAKEILTRKGSKITEIAKRAVRDSGYNYDVKLSQGFELYPKRVYGSYTFPSGSYYSVRLSIGDGKGKNWWCVLFPPMCRGGAVTERYEAEEELSKYGFSDSEIDIIKEDRIVRTEIRFFVLDFINGAL